MSKQISIWFATTAFTGLSIALISATPALAQPPGRGPGGPGGPERGGPPNVAEMFSHMDRNEDGKLTQDEVPAPVWSRLSHADTNGDGGVTKDEAARAIPGRRPDGARPDGGRPDGPPNDRSRADQSPGRGPSPPMDRDRSEARRPQERGSRGQQPQRGGPSPPHSPHESDRQQSGRPDNAHRGPTSFAPDAFFDRLDKNHDGSLSRDEFQAVAEFHRNQPSSGGPRAFSGGRGPSGPAMAHRGPGMPFGGPPWARGNSFGPQRFQGGPPWARFGHGPQFHPGFSAPPWAHSAPRDHGAPGPQMQHGTRSD